jgi:hypothetical protein
VLWETLPELFIREKTGGLPTIASAPALDDLDAALDRLPLYDRVQRHMPRAENS